MEPQAMDSAAGTRAPCREQKSLLTGKVLGIWRETNNLMTQYEMLHISQEILGARVRYPEALHNQLETKNRVKLEMYFYVV